MDLGASLISSYGHLPASTLASSLQDRLHSSSTIIVTAPPGAGKSTLLPLSMLPLLGEGEKILMLEPRRLAARQIAMRMASMLGEKVGESVGYRIRFEKRASSRTRIEVLTEGILTRMLVQDPTLEGVKVVIFDEFHERNLQTDLSLALCREIRSLLREDLRIVIMSATIDTEDLGGRLSADVLSCEGRMYPVELRYSEKDLDLRSTEGIVLETARTLSRALRENPEGDALVFLPGEGEIRGCARLLEGKLEGTSVCSLYGMLSQEEQAKAISPSREGERKVVLATPIAETSLTIEGVRIVVDSGLYKKMVYDPSCELSHLETCRISLDMAAQRAGRAGRLAPGVCYRLWTRATQSRMAPLRTPEILEADLSPTMLDISAWGEGEMDSLSWLTPPPRYSVAAARKLLLSLGAITEEGMITPHGRKLSSLPCHPRISQMLLGADSPEGKALACDIAAILDDRDPLRNPDDADLTLRITELRKARREGRSTSEEGNFRRAIQAAREYCSMMGISPRNDPVDPYDTGKLLCLAYPGRIGSAHQSGRGRFIFTDGSIAAVGDNDPLGTCDWIVAPVLSQRKEGTGRIFLCAPVRYEDLLGLSTMRDALSWDRSKGAVTARSERRIGALLLSSHPISDIPQEKIHAILAEAAVKDGLSMFDFSDEVQNLQRRIQCVALWHPDWEIPDVSTEAILGSAGEWIPLFAGKSTSSAQLRKIDICQVIWSRLPYDLQEKVKKAAPSHITVPSGSSIKVEYRQGSTVPIVRVRLQECFGLLDTPRVDGGTVPVLMELLSPGFKPVQLTSDLRSFWSGTYFEVRKELSRRYPKHSWPENPMEAEAVRGVKRK